MVNEKQLDELNKELGILMDEILSLPVDDEKTEILVSNLQGMVSRRQNLLSMYLNEIKDKQLLNEQLLLSKKFEDTAKKIQQERQDLLSVLKKGKRQLNVYKSVDSNR
ncbi:flagella biosynthesis chaperone for FliD, FliT [Shewanella yunxiaonensis]|uniref:Flagella biosynthesis chaperone for FliD, FliT n=1 Tax=Shewanella yunxiaonensis TaxID=2829809 RepID=A0ABX7YVQ5_9GAMM|nr:flagella biosynthesis chaperone for FliD, FliT [Shewanella yunxiaonensis]QUN06849.1 flagella biosynthesis chaperone for FliD, FliT [Shewanella yunxiaonensis]